MIDPKILHKKFIRFGLQRHKLKNEMLAILPQIYKSGIYKKYASSIYEYAGKYGDISKFAVETRLRIEPDLAEKPHLKAAIREVGVNKVAMIVKLATPETDEMFADKVRNMSKPAIQMLSKELRNKVVAGVVGDSAIGVTNFADVDGMASNLDSGAERLCHAVPEKIKIELDEEMTFLFLKLKEKMGKKLREKLSNREVMKMILKKMEGAEFPMKKSKSLTGQKPMIENPHVCAKLQKPKSLTGQKVPDGSKYGQKPMIEKHHVCAKPTDQESTTKKHQVCAKSKNSKSTANQELIEKRPIRAKRKREELKKTGGKCAYPGCNRPAQIFHHQDRFSENKNHKNLKGLCREHHEFMHNGLISNENDSPNNWKIHIKNKIQNKSDILYRKYRQKALQKL